MHFVQYKVVNKTKDKILSVFLLKNIIFNSILVAVYLFYSKAPFLNLNTWMIISTFCNVLLKSNLESLNILSQYELTINSYTFTSNINKDE